MVSRERDSIGSYYYYYFYYLFIFYYFTGFFPDEEIKITTEVEEGGILSIQHTNMIP